MANVVLTIHLLLAFSLIIVVLLQRSEGGGLGIGGGGGGVMTGRGAATALSKLTWALGAAFVVTSLSLTVIAARDTRSNSVIDRAPAGAEAPAGDLAAPPALGEDLLPPATPSEGPAAPPAAE